MNMLRSPSTCLLIRNEKKALRVELLRKGAKDLGMNAPMQVEVDAEASAVLASLPFSLDDQAPELDVSVSQEDEEDASTGAWLNGLQATIAERAANPDSGKTGTSLKKGLDYCAARFVSEVAELSEAMRKKGSSDVIEEAGQCIYWLLVTLQSGQIPFGNVLASQGSPQTTTEYFRQLRSVSSILPTPIQEAATDLCDAALEFSTAIRKGRPEDAAEAARGCLCDIFVLLQAFEISPIKVMKAEQEAKNPSPNPTVAKQ
jgi:phosphoribosyl-ATP pyrophosphohydrolase